MINIAYLYYDLMNLYGESGNIKALTNYLNNQNVKYKVHYLTIDDDLNFSKYDLVYIGYGTENNRNIVLKHLMNYKKDIKNYIESNKYFLVTGNALSLFGKSINYDDNKINCLNIFDYEVINEKRKAYEALFKFDDIKQVIVGFQNQMEYINNYHLPLFEVGHGRGYLEDNKKEGVHYKNFYGTYLIGPLLSRCPYFLEYFTKRLILDINPKFKIKNNKLELEKKAYKTFFNIYYMKNKENINE